MARQSGERHVAEGRIKPGQDEDDEEVVDAGEERIAATVQAMDSPASRASSLSQRHRRSRRHVVGADEEWAIFREALQHFA